MSPNGLIRVNSNVGRQYVRSQYLDASWSSFLDPSAGVYQYDYALVTANHTKLTPYASLNPGSPAASVSLGSEQMVHGLIVRFNTLARNFASASSEILGSDIIFDFQAPQCRYMHNLFTFSATFLITKRLCYCLYEL